MDEVCREYKRKPQDNPVDYALFLLRSPCLFVEAKALEKDLNDRKWISQILGYATVVGVEWCVLTNGDDYRLYNSHATVDVDEKLFRSVRISDSTQDPNTLDTLELLSKDKMSGKIIDDLWKAHFIDRHVKAALENLIGDEDGSLARLVRKNTPALTMSDIREVPAAGRYSVLTSLQSPRCRPLHQAGRRGEGTISLEPQVRETPGRKAWATRRKRMDAGEEKVPTTPSSRVHVSDLIEFGIITPPLEIEATFKEKRVTATINDNGTITFDGHAYSSPSIAAGMARNSVSGSPSDGRKFWQTNGWTFWKYHDPQTDELQLLDYLRQQCEKTVKANDLPLS